MSAREIPVEQARKVLGDLVANAQLAGVTTIITRYGRPAALITPIPQEPTVNSTHTLTIVRGEQPTANGAEFGLAGIKVSDEVYDWFAANGVSDDDPDVWVLVTPADEQAHAQHPIAIRDITASASTTYERTTDEGTDTIVITVTGDEVERSFLTDGVVTGGPDHDTADRLHDYLVDIKADGYREV